MRNERLFIRAVTTLKEFGSMEEEWNALLERSVSSSFFLTWEWLYTWAKHYLDRNRLWILLIYEGKERLIGIAPFYIRRYRAAGLFSIREVRFLGTEEVCSSYLDIISTNRHRKAVLKEIYQYLYGDAKGAWDILTLSDVPAESLSIDLLDSLVQEDGKVIEVIGMTACPVISLTGRLEDFMTEIGRSERYNIQRKRKRLEQAGAVVYERFSSADEVEKQIGSFIRLHESRWKQKKLAGAFKSERFASFHREVIRLLCVRGRAHLDFLTLEGEKIAAVYGYSYQGRYYFYLPGLNPEIVPQASPGRLLLFRCIERAIQNGDQEFDLLRGNADYKLAWANGLRRSLTLRHFSRTGRAAAAKLFDSGKDFVKILVR